MLVKLMLLATLALGSEIEEKLNLLIKGSWFVLQEGAGAGSAWGLRIQSPLVNS